MAHLADGFAIISHLFRIFRNWDPRDAMKWV